MDKHQAMISPKQFKRLVLAGKYCGQVVTCGLVADPEEVGDEEYMPRFVLSNGGVDRHGDSVNPAGWKLDAYKSNPVVLFNHDHNLPIGRAVEIGVANDQLKARVQFAPKGISPHADQVRSYVQAGMLKAVSVGFIPLSWTYSDNPSRRGAVDFTEQELVEFSIVSVPALSSALIEDTLEEIARPKGADVISFQAAVVRRLRLGASA